MDNRFYTDERGQQIVIALLKAHGIKKIVASPGTTNITLVASMQHDPWFEMYSSVDERSAAYIACGLAAESGETVVLSCTGATASRNYMPGLTEAYYRKLPIIAITATQGNWKLGHLIGQNIDRRVLPNDIALCSVYIPIIQNAQEERSAEVDVNRAILETKRRGGGPVHINLQTGYSINFSTEKLPPARVIDRITYDDEFPSLPQVKIAIYVGCHSLMSEDLEDAIDRFCATYDSIVLCDHSSGYHGKYRVQYPLVDRQQQFVSQIKRNVDILIHIGEIMSTNLTPFMKSVWRVSRDGELRDTFGKLRYVFEMPEITFFNHYAKDGCSKDNYLKACMKECDLINKAQMDIPFSNIWIAQHLSTKLPSNCAIHFGILNSFRSWNFFELPAGVSANCNLGAFGIDGNISSLIGASLSNSNKLFFGVFGDLGFFYDMNSLGNHHVGNNLRILIVNNGLGAEMTLGGFRVLGEDLKPYIIAAGHYGDKSPKLVRHYAEDLGYRYLSASNKEEFLEKMEEFTLPEIGEHSIIFECFINPADEQAALGAIGNLYTNTAGKIKTVVKKTLGQGAVDIVKKVLR